MEVGLLLRGLSTASARRRRALASAGILLSAALLCLLLLLFPGAAERPSHPLDGIQVLSETPRLLTLWIVFSAVLLWAVWSLFAGMVMRGTVVEMAGDHGEEPASRALARWSSIFLAPILVALAAAALLAAALGVLQVSRVPYAGWPLLVLLSPLLLLLAGAAVWILVRWALAGHLVGPGVATDGSTAFASIARAFTYFRAAPGRVVGLRLLALGIVIVQGIVRMAVAVAGVAALYLLLRTGGEETVLGIERTLREGLGSVGPATDVAAVCAVVLVAVIGSWIASVPLTLLMGARAALFLVHRRDLDGVPPDAPLLAGRAEPSLADLGIRLVQRLRDETGEP